MTEQDRPEHPDARPVETPESRMTGEGGPPPDEREKDRANGPEFAVVGDDDDEGRGAQGDG
ncbi:hypothetical protein LN042_01355 [Kitasatospora sp. RB6PN24]|uniref:hypothetical protein n=1 Tax=Kitasatospora humi TaxID=2893891 RepID=UPI001E3343FE|nr:hypothetical protein [Kitasatospora humi]MCC9305766.1 hypothetical protein [Kitasatospora humi]